MPSLTDDELFKQFLEQVQNRAVQELSLDVQPHNAPFKIQWGAFASPHLFTFDPQRAREEGLHKAVSEAIDHISGDMPGAHDHA